MKSWKKMMVCSLVACSLLGTGGMMTARAAESVTEGHRRCIFKMAHGRWQEISICPRIWKRQKRQGNRSALCFLAMERNSKS